MTAGLLVAGCGGSGSEPTDAQQPVADVVGSWVKGTGARERCESLSDRFVREVYGSRVRCRSEDARSRESPVAPALRQRIAIKDGAAVDDVTLVGGIASGATGAVELVRQRGEWRIDGLRIDLLRGLFTRVVFHKLRRVAEAPGLRDEPARRCVESHMAGLSDDRFRERAYAWIGGRGNAGFFLDVMLGCLNAPGTGPDGLSYLRHHVIEDFVNERVAELGLSERERSCAARRLRTHVSDREVLAHVKRDRSAPPPDATRHLAGVVVVCQDDY